MIIKRIQHTFEKNTFGVCAFIGEKAGLAVGSIRLFFIYASFLTLGSPLIIYLILAFIVDSRKHWRKSHRVFS